MNPNTTARHRCFKAIRLSSAHFRRAISFGFLLLLTPSVAFSQFTIGTNFTGTSLSNEPALNGGFEYIPPDTMGGVGPTRIAEILNGAFSVYDKTGVLQSRVGLDSFWNTAFANSGVGTTTSSSFDPRILYDSSSNHWYAVAVDNGGNANSRFLVGVTTGNDPAAANWRGFAIKADSASTRWADYPTIGMDASGLFISANMFSVGSFPPVSTLVNFIGVPKASLDAVTPSISGMVKQENINPNTTGFALQPAVDLSNAGLPLPILSAYNTPLGFLKRSDVPSTFFTTPTLDTSGPFIGVTPRSGPPDGRQPGTNDNIDTGDTRFDGNVVLQNGRLWAAHSVNVSGRAAIEWYKVDQSSNTLLQSGLISDPTKDLYYPSIAVNSSDTAVIGFSGSDDNTPVSTYFAVGLTTAGTTVFNPITQSQLGSGSYFVDFGAGENRWGDYSSTVLDPSDPNCFWTFQEFANGTDNWGIRITQICMVPEPTTAAVGLIGLVGFIAYVRRHRRERA